MDCDAGDTLLLTAPESAFLNGRLARMLQLSVGVILEVGPSYTTQELRELCNC